jgi:glycosyltransferase involved in cell wall biosynthesis
VAIPSPTGAAPATPPAVSILLASRDRPSLLAGAVASVRSQTFPFWELWLVNDGGPPLGDWVRGLGEPRLHLIELASGRGQVAARNLALERCRGRFVALLDDDDRWYPWHLARLVRAVQRHPAVWYGDAEVVTLSPDRWGHWRPRKAQVFSVEASAAGLRRYNTVVPSGLLYPRWLHDLLGPFDPAMNHYWDWDWLLRCASATSLNRLGCVTVRYGVTGLGQSQEPARMREHLDALCRKHALGVLPSANFALLATAPELAPARRPTRLPDHWSLPHFPPSGTAPAPRA